MERIAIVGSGVVGKTVGGGFAKRGHEITFVDADRRVLRELWGKGQEAVPPEFLDVKETDIVFVAVPTPTVNGRIVTDYICEASEAIGVALRRAGEAGGQRYRVIAIKSTIPPGTTDGLVLPILERRSGQTRGRDFGVAVTPEYLRERRAEEDFDNPRVVVVGTSEERTYEVLRRLYQQHGWPIRRLSPQQAEFHKYVHNLFNATKISFFNELRQMARALGINPQSVFELTALSAEGMWNPSYGTKDMGPFDGSCLPKDTEGFLAFARERGIPMPLLTATITVNESLREETSHVA